MGNVQYYRSFSINQHRFIKACGEKYLYKKVHPKTLRTYWVYQVTEELSKLLTIWSEKKNLKN
ncbi:hypothetical protein CN689_14235 [Peribacillus butanolivorans]|uniref:Uncharacterized protein n=1 Tax=Peribacillus butanolivorans TaxID=421767 RepID=A0AAX0RRR7_9BACI|nr:hypothetical protein [Peribacillus butanolivorans]PEJ32284.1 hypothetical protein CN689_14235 [Peribacillus butanolivorans]